jgi:hypothetical protein
MERSERQMEWKEELNKELASSDIANGCPESVVTLAGKQTQFMIVKVADCVYLHIETGDLPFAFALSNGQYNALDAAMNDVKGKNAVAGDWFGDI